MLMRDARKAGGFKNVEEDEINGDGMIENVDVNLILK
jgi:hypothetical protein